VEERNVSSYPSSFDHMLAAWNEPDVERVRGHLDQALSPQATFVDPTIVTRGIDEFEANVREFRSTFADARCYRTSGFDSHHRHYRYSWAIDSGGATIVEGFDVVELDDEDRVLRVQGFFGPLPPLES
jgi:hypothetical protein